MWKRNTQELETESYKQLRNVWKEKKKPSTGKSTPSGNLVTNGQL